MNFIKWTDEQIEKLLRSIHRGKFSSKLLPNDLYESTLTLLAEAIVSGFGTVDNPILNASLDQLIEGVSVFSAAKTFQQVREMEKLITGGDGTKIKYSDFKESAGKVFDTFNNNYLKTEFNTAFSRSQASRQWLDIEAQANVFPLLKYSTVEDQRVRDDHDLLNDIIKPVNDPFWNRFYPPNGWNCRCIVEQIEEGEVTDLRKKTPPKLHPLFATNPAKTGIIFDEKVHPYFNVSKRFKIAPRTKDGKIQVIKAK